MDSGKRQHLQDIYATDPSLKDDFTPQVSNEILEERKRDLQRQRMISFLLGLTILFLSLLLVFVIVREYINLQTKDTAVTPIPQGYIPRHSLPSESQWVLDFPRSYGDPQWSGEGERPFNVEWLKKATFNLIMAQQAETLQKNEEAIVFYENALEILPDLEGVKIPLGTLYFKVGKFEKAIALLEDVPDSELTPDVRNNLGVAYLNAGAYDQAESYLKSALKERPDYPEPEKNLASLYEKQNREDEAISAYEKYIDLKPDDLDTRQAFALYLTKLGRWDQAATVLEKLTQEVTDVPVLYFLLARAETHNNQPEKALKAIRRGIELSDPSAALGYMDDKEFEQLRSSDDFKEMVQSLEQAKKGN